MKAAIAETRTAQNGGEERSSDADAIREMEAAHNSTQATTLVALMRQGKPMGFYETITRGEPNNEAKRRRTETLERSHAMSQKSRTEGTLSGHATARKSFDRALARLGLEVQRDLLLNMNIMSNRELIRNIFRMVLQDMYEFDPENRKRTKRVEPQTISRYARVVVADLDQQRIDVSFVTEIIDDWKTGTDRFTASIGARRTKKKKAGITPKLLTGMLAAWECPLTKAEEQQDTDWIRAMFLLTMQCAAVVMFAFLMRRKEAFSGTDRNGVFNGHIGFSRDHVAWLDRLGKPVIPTRENLEGLVTNGGFMTLRPPRTKTDQDLRVHGDTCIPYPVGTLQKRPNRDLDVTSWMMRLEIADPVLNHTHRRMTPCFRSPITGDQIKVDRFDKQSIKAIYESRKANGEAVTMKQVKDEFSLKSYRVGGLNGLEENEVPTKYRKRVGRWLRELSMDNYSRMKDMLTMAGFMELQEHEDTTDKTLSIDLPMAPEQRADRRPGYITIGETSTVQCLEEQVEALREEIEKMRS